MKAEWRLVLDIFWSFFKIGPVTFGGGYAMIPLIEREVVTRRKWMDIKDVSDIFAVAESLPGAIAVNSATFVGYRVGGVKGAIAALAGVVLPPFIIVLALSFLFLFFKDNPKVEAAFIGIRPAIVALIVYAGYKIGQLAIIDKTTLAAVGVTVSLLLVVHIHPVMIILGGALTGILLVKVKEKMGYSVFLDEEEQPENTHPGFYMGAGI